MSVSDNTTSPLGIFERWLSLWVALAILGGIILGNLAPAAISDVAALEIASVNLVVAVLIWAMIYPMMVGVDFSSIRDVGRKYCRAVKRPADLIVATHKISTKSVVGRHDQLFPSRNQK